VIWPRHATDNLGAHESASHTAMARRPINASDIRYAVMLASTFRHESKMRHDRVSGDHFRREPYPSRRDLHGGSSRRGRGRTWTLSHAACRHVRACQLIEGSDGHSLAALRRCGEDVAPRRAAAVRFKKPATGFPARAQFLRCWRYAGDLPDVSNLLRDPRQRVPSQVPELAARPLCWQPFRELWRLAARPLCWQLFREL
jgi:hypothetical protein